MDKRKHTEYEAQWNWYKNVDSNILNYWAGILDGEGCLKRQINNKILTPRISLKMTCEKTVKKFSEVFKAPFQKVKRTKSFKPNYKDQWVCKINGHQAAKLAETLIPFLITKKDDAKILATHYNKPCKFCKKIFWCFNGNTHCSDRCKELEYNEKRKSLRKEYRENNPLSGKIEKFCVVEGCGKKQYGLGLCRNHYRKQKYSTNKQSKML